MTGSSSNDVAEMQLKVDRLERELASVKKQSADTEKALRQSLEVKSAELAESLEYQAATSEVLQIIARTLPCP